MSIVTAKLRGGASRDSVMLQTICVLAQGTLGDVGGYGRGCALDLRGHVPIVLADAIVNRPHGLHHVDGHLVDFEAFHRAPPFAAHRGPSRPRRLERREARKKAMRSGQSLAAWWDEILAANTRLD